MADQAPRPPYETGDIGPGLATLGLLGFAAAVVLPLILVTLLYGAFWQRAEPDLGRAEAPPPDGPATAPTLQVAPGHDLAEFRRRVGERLNGLGWVDRERGVAHIPIDEAMRLHLERAR